MEPREIDDLAAIALFPPGADLVSGVNLFPEEVHPDLALISAPQLACQASAFSLDDIADLGARPRFGLRKVHGHVAGGPQKES